VTPLAAIIRNSISCFARFGVSGRRSASASPSKTARDSSVWKSVREFYQLRNSTAAWASASRAAAGLAVLGSAAADGLPSEIYRERELRREYESLAEASRDEDRGAARTATFDVHLTGALLVLGNESFRYVREVVGPHDAVLEFVAEVDGLTVNGVDMIRWGEDGRITDFKVMIRPLKAVNLIHQKMAAALSATKR